MNIIIIGGVAGGMSAATRARRMNEHANITVLEKGAYISFANCGLPYYLGGTIPNESSLLVTTAQAVRQRFRIDVRVAHEATAIDRNARLVHVTDLRAGSQLTLPYDKLILATGAQAVIPPIEHVRSDNVFVLRSMEDTQAIHAFLTRHKPARVALIGGGFIGLEMAEQMKHRGLDVTLVEKNPHVLPPLDPDIARPLADELKRNGVAVFEGSGLQALDASHGRVTAVVLDNGTRLPTDMVILSIGVRPNVRLAADAGLRLGTTGGVSIDPHGRTSDPDIYALGDMVELRHGITGAPARIPLAGPANRHGRLVGEHAATGHAPALPPAIGTAIVNVFDLAAGITGLSEKAAAAAGIDFDTALTFNNQHAAYYPGATPIRLKIVFEKSSGKLLGAQAVGQNGVDKRLDVIATAIHFNATIHDLAQLDLAYSPQFGSAKDPVHIAAFVATNQHRGISPSIAAADLRDQTLIDVRTPAEFAQGALPGAINIPLDELRQRLAELDPARPCVTYCKVGQRGYAAQRILLQNGFTNVKNLKGGYSAI